MEDNYNPKETTPEQINNTAPETAETVYAPDVPVENPADTPPQPAGALFGTIAYQKVEDIPIFIERMKIQDAAFIMVSAATYAHKKGILTLLESEVLSKAVRLFTTPPPTTMPLEPPVEEKKSE